MKAILVIDVPEKYSDKDIYVLHEIYTYEGSRYERIEEYKEGLYKAKPLPQKIDKVDYFKKRCVDYDFGLSKEIDGYNHCINEILGECNEEKE